MKECTTTDIMKNGMVTMKIYDVDTGKVRTEKRNLEVTINRIKEGIENYVKTGPYKVLGEFYNDIIWTFRINTAATDGIRLYFNPLFANRLVELGGKSAVKLKNKMVKEGKTKREIADAFFFEAYKYIVFIVIHECYHQLYRHIELAQFKEETKDGKNHRLANIAMDDQINRDIEIQWPEFEGCTKATDGWIEKEKYPFELWEDIFDDKYKKGDVIPPPPQPTPPMGPDNGNNGGNDEDEEEPDHQTAAKDYADGWAQAIEDIKSGKVNPRTFRPLPVNTSNFDHEVLGYENGMTQMPADPDYEMMLAFNQDEWNQGYNDCIAKALEQAGSGPQQPGRKVIFDNLEDPPKINQPNGGGNGSGEDGEGQESDNQNDQGSSGEEGDDNQNGQNGGQQSSHQQQGQNGGQQQKGAGKGGSSQGNSGNDNGQGQSGEGEDTDGQQQGQNGQGGNKTGQGQQQGSQQGQGDGDGIQPMRDRTKLGDGKTGSRADETGGGEVYEVSHGQSWGTDDLISKEDGMKISEAEGKPFTSDEVNQSPEVRAKQIIQQNMNKLKQIGKGTARSMEDIFTQINEILAPPVIKWKSLLAKLFRNAGVKDKVENKMRKSRFGQDRLDKYDLIDPKKHKERNKNVSADIFYLVDKSGSISDRELYRAFSEIIAIETYKDMNIRKSAFTYFAMGINVSRIREWFKEDSKKKKMELITYVPSKDQAGGTDIAGSVVQVTKLPRRFYSAYNPKTLIIVFTDGEDFGFDQLSPLPRVILQNLIFIIMNNGAEAIAKAAAAIEAAGVPSNHIIGIDITKDLPKE